MSDDGGDSWKVRFLKANANKDYMAGVLADCIRNCMRGVGTAFSGDPASAANRASEDFAKLIELMKYAGDDVRLRQLFVDAISEIRPIRPDGDIGNDETFARRSFESSKLSAAMSGIQFIVERSCRDNAAKGRASRRESDFLDSLREIDEDREEMIRDREKRQASQGTSPSSDVDRALEAKVLASVMRSMRSRKPNSQ